MRNAASIARGAASETSEPIAELISRSMLIRPRPTLTGSISTSTRRDARVAPVEDDRSGKPTRRSCGHAHQRAARACRPARRSRRRRAGSAPRTAASAPTSAAMITRFHTSGAIAGIAKCSWALRIPTTSPLSPSSTTIGNSTRLEADGEVVELRRELVAGEQRHDHRRERDEHERHRAQRDEEQAEQRARELDRLPPPPLLDQLGEDGHEGGARAPRRRPGAHEVRHLEGERERRGRARVPK